MRRGLMLALDRPSVYISNHTTDRRSVVGLRISRTAHPWQLQRRIFRPQPLMKYLPLIFRNLFRNRRRTILSVLSIGISMFIFSALMSLPAVVRELLRDRTSNLRLDAANKAGFGGFDYTLPLAYGA